MSVGSRMQMPLEMHAGRSMGGVSNYSGRIVLGYCWDSPLLQLWLVRSNGSHFEQCGLEMKWRSSSIVRGSKPPAIARYLFILALERSLWGWTAWGEIQQSISPLLPFVTRRGEAWGETEDPDGTMRRSRGGQVPRYDQTDRDNNSR